MGGPSHRGNSSSLPGGMGKVEREARLGPGARRRRRRPVRNQGQRDAGRNSGPPRAGRHTARHEWRRDPGRAPSSDRPAEQGPLSFEDPERIRLGDRGAGWSHGHSRLERRRSSRAGAGHRARTGVTQEASRWDDELQETGSPSPLLQSWAWGEVQARAGWKIERIGLKGGAMASVQVRSVGPAREAYVPRGPVPASVEAIDALVEWARDAKIARLVVEPEAPVGLTDALTERGFSAVASIQPQHTRILHLRQPDEMLKTFKHGRRYNIRAGLRRGREGGWRGLGFGGGLRPGAGPDHPWDGLGVFKSEFGGAEVAYAGAWELVLSAVGTKLISLEKRSRSYVRGLKRNIS